MIYYFTGTGNSLYVAKVLGINLEMSIHDLSENFRHPDRGKQIDFTDGEILGFVFPVYAWGPPKWVLDFIKGMKIKDDVKPGYIFAIATCGENIGNTMGILEKSLKEKGWELDYGYSLKMPNNYMIFGTDAETGLIAEEKIRRADLLLDHITKDLKIRGKGFFLETGPFPKLLTSVVHPLFSKGVTKPSKFRANDRCTSCETCCKVCNTQTIRMVQGIPRWGKECVQCLACINLCPEKAIDYGRGTRNKHRYKNPRISSFELEKK